ncbi:NAD+ synthase [Aestuariicella sp. G3-2]|uniref:NAD+ synthase n=1 Tax=Pseudomaricurvus albidus TaxID=2842452 RepID=UPI001C0DFD32|nr:NAD+ synthase [Aestuariicella albida]MBU3070689.1 NAD+ synthase [Aestuariicella albida]
MPTLKIVMAQVNPLVGDIQGNTELVIDTVRQAESEHSADIVIFPELTLTGYPPEDLLLRESLELRIDRALESICSASLQAAVVVGYPRVMAGRVFNMAGVIDGGEITAEYAKQHLPNYKVFDEKRYFVSGDSPCIVRLKGIKAAVTICEDIWQVEPMHQAKQAGAQLMLNINASPFHIGKINERRKLLHERAREGQMPILYVNQVGAQDELIFDGASMVVDAEGEVRVQAPSYEELLLPVTMDVSGGECTVRDGSVTPEPERLASVYEALVLCVRDYVNKNGFKGVVLGLSGGIDSALTLAIAVDALGKDRVEAIMMPFRYTSDLSKNDAADEAQRLGVAYQSISIEPMFESFMTALEDEFAGTLRDTTEENLQARCRGVVLMAISNKKGYLVLTTGNKSEMAVGYSTLYGDMAGGFDVLKDVPKVLVFELARYRNTIEEVIPVSVIERPPSAELAPDQKDEDSLPPYEDLDRILELYVERDCSATAIIAEGFEPDVVHRVLRLVDVNEYKRRQAPVGPRITERGFGRDRRYPITNGWKIGD